MEEERSSHGIGCKRFQHDTNCIH